MAEINLDSSKQTDSIPLQPNSRMSKREDSITTAKVVKVALLILAGFTGAISFLAFTVGTAPALLLAIPTLCITGALLWMVTRVKDYENPQQLEKYRTLAANQPLEKTAKEHGWAAMFKHEIPTKENFTRLYNDMVNKGSFHQLMEHYEKLSIVRETCLKNNPNAFTLPHPKEFLHRFKSECEEKKVCDIFDKHNIKQLCEYEILPKIALSLRDEYLGARDIHAKAIDAAASSLIQKYIDALTKFGNHLNKFQLGTIEQLNWIEQQKATIAKCSPVINTDIYIFENEHANLQKLMSNTPSEAARENFAPIVKYHNHLGEQLQTVFHEHQESLKKIDAEFSSLCSTINEAINLSAL